MKNDNLKCKIIKQSAKGSPIIFHFMIKIRGLTPLLNATFQPLSGIFEVIHSMLLFLMKQQVDNYELRTINHELPTKIVPVTGLFIIVLVPGSAYVRGARVPHSPSCGIFSPSRGFSPLLRLLLRGGTSSRRFLILHTCPAA